MFRSAVACACGLVLASPARAQQSSSSQQSPTPAPVEWQYGGFVDVGYLNSTNDPTNHLFRNRGTTFRVDELDVNMVAAYARKSPSESSRFGVELTGQTGQDSRIFGFSATAPNIAGADWLRHLGPTNMSYLAPAGRGLTIQGGIFNSLIGYDSLYAKDNFNYTRPWGADYTPYLMLGVNGAYPLTSRLTLTGFLINGYWHLAHANDVPSSGGQIAYKPNDRVTVKETVLYGPHQSDTSLKYWRFLSDSIMERKRDPLTVAVEFIAATERVAEPGDLRAWWISGQLPVHWSLSHSLAITLRPEAAWDSAGRWTGFEQTITAFTSTLEYRIPYRRTQTIARVEYRFDNSRGVGGGFFEDGESQAGIPKLTPTQHLIGVALILTFDGTYRP